MRSLRKYSTAFGNNVIHNLRSRGMVAQLTSPDLERIVENKKITLYAGIDPSAKSLHVGNLAVLMTLAHFHFTGHRVLPLIGGATGRVGDPGGRSTERELLDHSLVDSNAESITKQVQTFFSRVIEHFVRRQGESSAGESVASTERTSSTLIAPTVLNNLSWLSDTSLLSFLRFPGKKLKVNVLMTRDSVKSRLASEQGLSFAEFSYQLLQAYDFYMLNRDHGCVLQVGGSDQWGNIISGVELIKQASSPERSLPASSTTTDNTVYGLTIPLLITSNGEKFGKSAGNAIWLDPKLTSVYDFYQFFIRVHDVDVLPYLRYFTLLSPEEMESLYARHMETPQLRIAQQKLAEEVTEIIHGSSALRGAQAATSALFDSRQSLRELSSTDSAQSILDALGDHPNLHRVSVDEVIGVQVGRIATKYGLTQSNARAMALIKSGGLYLNKERVSESTQQIRHSDFMGGKLVILRAGKGDHLILAVK